jgi:hypothetical protein
MAVVLFPAYKKTVKAYTTRYHAATPFLTDVRADHDVKPSAAAIAFCTRPDVFVP